MLTVAVGPISSAEKTDCARRMMERKSDEDIFFRSLGLPAVAKFDERLTRQGIKDRRGKNRIQGYAGLTFDENKKCK